MFFRSKKQRDVCELITEVGDALTRSITQINAEISILSRELTAISSEILHYRREAEASKLKLDRMQASNDDADANLAEVKRQLQQAQDELAQAAVRNNWRYRLRDVG